MRQHEVASLGRLLLALLLALPLLDAGRVLGLSGAFLVEFLHGDGLRPLSRLTAAPARSALPLTGVAVDRYVKSVPPARVPLVLVHGLTGEGKDDPRLAAAAALLARVGFDVAVPTVPGLTRWRLRPDDREPVVATLAARPGRSVLVGVSIGAGVALLAASDARVRDDVGVVLSLGGYASAVDLIRYYLAGEYGESRASPGRRIAPELIRRFVDANADILDPSAQRVLQASGPEDVRAALAGLSPGLLRLLDAVSPIGVARDVRADVVLVHGRDDVAVPYLESVRLQRALGARARLVLVGLVEHVERGRPASLIGALGDAVALWSVAYALVSLA